MGTSSFREVLVFVAESLYQKGVGVLNFHLSLQYVFFGWVFGMDGAIEIVAPQDTVEAYLAMLNRSNSVVAKKP